MSKIYFQFFGNNKSKEKIYFHFSAIIRVRKKIKSIKKLYERMFELLDGKRFASLTSLLYFLTEKIRRKQKRVGNFDSPKKFVTIHKIQITCKLSLV